MFETIEEDERRTAQADKGAFYVKASVFVVAMAVLGAVIYFFAFVPYGKH